MNTSCTSLVLLKYIVLLFMLLLIYLLYPEKALIIENTISYSLVEDARCGHMNELSRVQSNYLKLVSDPDQGMS